MFYFSYWLCSILLMQQITLLNVIVGQGGTMSGHYTGTQIGLSELIGSFRSNLKFSTEIGQKNGTKIFFHLDENRKSDSTNSQILVNF